MQPPPQTGSGNAASSGQQKQPRAGLSRIGWLLLGAAALGLVGFVLAGGREHLSVERFLSSREALAAFTRAHLLLAMAAYAGLYLAIVALSIPGGTLLTVAGGFLFGGWRGGALTLVAATAGATCLFLIARSSLGQALAARAGPRLARLRAGFVEDAASYMLFLRLTPVFPFWLVNLAAALLDVPLATFLWTTLIGIAPATLAFSLAGAGLDSVITAQKAAQEACVAAGQIGCEYAISLKSLVTRELVMAFGALGVVALLPVALKLWQARRELWQARRGRGGADETAGRTE